MLLDRQTNPDRSGKYALILNRRIAALPPAAQREVEDALKVLREHGVLNDGVDPETEFFVLYLRDEYAAAALRGYSHEVSLRGGALDYAKAVHELMRRSLRHPSRRQPN